jgi:hypothetical protein
MSYAGLKTTDAILGALGLCDGDKMMSDTITDLMCAIFCTRPTAEEAAHNTAARLHHHASRLWQHRQITT